MGLIGIPDLHHYICRGPFHAISQFKRGCKAVIGRQDGDAKLQICKHSRTGSDGLLEPVSYQRELCLLVISPSSSTIMPAKDVCSGILTAE